MNKTIQEGDVFAAACGEKEPSGHVRVLGLGSTPQDISTPGLKSYIPTRLQMAVLARKRASNDVRGKIWKLSHRMVQTHDTMW